MYKKKSKVSGTSGFVPFFKLWLLFHEVRCNENENVNFDNDNLELVSAPQHYHLLKLVFDNTRIKHFLGNDQNVSPGASEGATTPKSSKYDDGDASSK